MHRLASLVALVIVGAWPATASAATGSYDFDDNGRPEIAAGLPYWTEAGRRDVGAVAIFPGRRLSTTPRVIDQTTSGVPGASEAEDHFGHAVAGGDFDGDGYDDLVVGAPFDAVHEDETTGSGSIRILFGTRGGLDTAHVRVLARPRRDDLRFGEHLALGDFDGDGRDDLVEGLVGYQRFRSQARLSAGAILLRKGGGHGPRAGREISQSTRGVPGSSEGHDTFGYAVAVGDLDRDGHADIVVGSPGEDGAAGRIVILRADGGGISRRHARTLTQRDRGVPGSKAEGHLFGSDLALRRLAGDRNLDLVTATGNRSLFEIPGGRHGLVFRHATAYDLRRRLGHRGETPSGLPGEPARGAVIGR